MFTGIIEEIGTVESILASSSTFKIKIKARKILNSTAIGDSISVNGVCLTVTSITHNAFTVDVMPETVKATTLKRLANSSKVNLERAMSANGRFGGHFVTGHVDGIGKIMKRTAVSNAVYYVIVTAPSLLKYMIVKGSVAVDGTSLTIFGLTDSTFTISLIPHTLSETVLGHKGVGDIVNLESDMLAKYIEKYSASNKAQPLSSLSPSFLEKHGYL
ncbi:MAG: riboflavin synthase [Tuberibacillus sp.]